MATESLTSGTEAKSRPAGSPIAALRRIGRTPVRAEPVERCELCGAALASEHPHVFDVKEKRMACSCPACTLLMVERPTARYVQVPDHVRELEHFAMSDGQWQSLNVPIDLAFFVIREGKPAAFYPSPAGATEASVSVEAWRALVTANPELNTLRNEVEALLVHRLLGQRMYFIVPIDVCYELVGLVRVHWRGLSGGTEIWKRVNTFFEALRQRAHRARRTISTGGANA